MRKRMTSLLLTLVMLLSLVPAMGATASAADDIENWSRFKSYLESTTSRDLTLENDIDYTMGYDDGAILITKSQKLDLNGHKIRIDASRRAEFYNLITIRSGEFTLYDSKGGGAIEVEFARDSKGHCIIMISPDSAGAPAKFTMNGGTLTRLNPMNSGAYGNNGCISDNYFVKFKGGERPQITINGGTINCAYDWDRSNASMRLVEYMPTALLLRYSKLTVNGGAFNGIVWTDELLWREGDAEPRVLLNGGVFNFPFAVTGLLKNKTQMVIDGARFNDGLYVAEGIKLHSYEGNEPAMLIKSGVFDASGQNLKLDIRSVTADGWYTAQGRQKAIKYAMKLFPNSAIKLNGNIYTSENIGSRVKYADTDGYYLNLNLKGPIEVIRDAWGMKSVTLDGDPIDYFKDWNGTVERMDNSTAHTLKFEWYPLAQELKDAGYSYLTKCEHYISGSTAVQQTDTIAADKTSHTITIPAGADPKVYSYDLHLNLQKGDNNIGIISNEHIVKLVVSKAPPAPPEPPAPVAHSITVTNGRGTANPTSAMAGETVTVKAKDDTANNMMFTQWYTDTPGVTFANVNDRETTFVMPDCDVKVNPGFQQVSFTKQPIDSWPQVNHGSKATVTFSAPITKWELKEGNTTVASSGSLFINTGNPITVDIPAQSSEVEKTYTVVVTANGQKFSSNEFKVSWVNWPKAPAVEFTPADGTQFVGKIEVIASDALYAGEEFFDIVYTINGGDPKDDTAPIDANNDTEHITLKDTATIRARTHNPEATEEGAKWGPLATATFTKYSDSTLPMPTITPEGTTYTGSIKAYLTAPALDGVKLEYQLVSPGEEPSDTQWHEYDPETGITVNEFGTSVLCARASKSYDAETPDGQYYVATITSENATATYTRTYSAAIDNVTVSGKVGEALTQDVVIRMNGDRFENVNVTAGEDVSNWFTNRPAGLTAKVKALSDTDGYHGTLTVTVSGTPEATSAAAITVTIPKDKLYANNTADLTVLSNPKAVYNIGTDVAHTHDYTGQPYLYLDPGNHYQECTAGDGYNIQAHAFAPWTDNGNGTHSRHCTVCKMTDGSTYTETANHNWQWVVDTAATPNAAGKQHEECPDCGAKRNENTVIPATGGGSSSGGGSSGGGGGGGSYTPSYTVSVDKTENGTITVSPKSASKGSIVTITVKPDKGYTLETLTVLDKNGYALELTEKNGRFTFKMPASAVIVKATFMDDNTMLNLFVDVKASDYFYDAVLWAAEKGVTSGTDALHFSPNAPCTRAQIVTFLWRAAGSPAPKNMSSFTDVPADAFYAKAVAWAVENGITGGTGDGKFSPDATCTRAQSVTFLYRAAGSPKVSSSAEFGDVATNAYYADAVAWAAKNGITGGIGGGLFGSDNNCTRAQIVTFLYRSVK